MTTDSPCWVGMVEIRTSTELLRILTLKRPSLRQAFLGNVEARHQLEAQRHGGRNLGASASV